MVSPGSENIRATAEADGILQELRESGVIILSKLCGSCVSSWDQKVVGVRSKEKNSVIASFNRNFVSRHDSSPATHSFVTSPELVTAFAYAGKLDFNPLTDSVLVGETFQKRFSFNLPVSQELPAQSQTRKDTFQEPSVDSSSLTVVISSDSDRLQPFQR